MPKWRIRVEEVSIYEVDAADDEEAVVMFDNGHAELIEKRDAEIYVELLWGP